MKKCPFCAEDIQEEAVKCRFCGEFLDRTAKLKAKWYFRTPVVVFAVLCLGPLALSLIWLNPRYTPVVKIVGTVLVIALTFGLGYAMIKIYFQFMESISELGIG